MTVTAVLGLCCAPDGARDDGFATVGKAQDTALSRL
jgi:hypothetical protein